MPGLVTPRQLLEIGSRITKERAERLALTDAIEEERARLRLALLSADEFAGFGRADGDTAGGLREAASLLQYASSEPQVDGDPKHFNSPTFRSLTVLEWTGCRDRGCLLVALDHNHLMLLGDEHKNRVFGSRQRACYRGLGVGGSYSTPVHYWKVIGQLVPQRIVGWRVKVGADVYAG